MTLGPVPEGDVAAGVAADLGVRAVTAPAFDPPGERVRAATRECLREADALVTAGHGDVVPATNTPRVRAALGPRPARGDGGTGAVVESESELLAAVRRRIDP